MYSTTVSEDVFAAWERGEVARALEAALRAWWNAPAACIGSAHGCSEMAVLLPRLPEAVTEVQIEGASDAVVEAVERAAAERPWITLRVLEAGGAEGTAT